MDANDEADEGYDDGEEGNDERIHKEHTWPCLTSTTKDLHIPRAA